MTTRFVDVPGGRLFTVDEGAGPPIALLHAGIADQRSWNEIVPLLNATGYRTIRYDQRGTGGSTTEDVAFFRAADLLAVLDGCGVGRAVLVGNSMGGVLAFDTAIEAPDRVVAIVGVAAGLGGFDGGNTPEELAMFDEMERLETARHLESNAPNARALIWPDVAHMIGMEQPERLTDAIVDFLAPMERWS